MRHVKAMTSKPVVTVGRFTSPDTMARWVKSGLVDLIGAARPSIADPFLPKKIEEGRLDEIRECIGCNVCYAGDGIGVPIRCTQNPAMGEEWRRGWHPERLPPAPRAATVLIVGAGPAGLEAARAAAVRGYEVMLAEAGTELGGRVTREARLPGLGEWIRVRDYRVQALQKMPNVQIFLDSEMTAEAVREVGADHVGIATGARWRPEVHEMGAFRAVAPEGVPVLTPDAIMAGQMPEGPTLVFDGDGYYHGAAIAEKLAAAGRPVTYATAEDSVASWGGYTIESGRVRARLMRLGVRLVLSHAMGAFDGARARLACVYTGAEQELAVTSLVMVSARWPNDGLYRALLDAAGGDPGALPFTLKRIGDCEAPALIAAATHAGYRYAFELDAPDASEGPPAHDRVDVGFDGLEIPAHWK
jgi:dimethylamine/trimethylamine dehydrogenase